MFFSSAGSAPLRGIGSLFFPFAFFAPLREISFYFRRIAGDDGIGGDVLRHHAAGADDGAFADGDVADRMVELEPMEAPFLTRVGSTFQSASVCRLRRRSWPGDRCR